MAMAGTAARRIATGLSAMAMLLSVASAAQASDQPFNEGWLFHRDGTDFDPARAEQVSLPHTTRIEPRVVNDQWQGDAWYARTFDAPASWRGQSVMLRFEAAMNVADVWINGQHLTTHLGGYLPFTVDLTPYLKIGGSNDIRVKLDNRDNPVTGPKPLKLLDFNTYGGLYRGVRLIVKPPVHLSDEMLADKVAGGGLFVTYPSVSAAQASVKIAADLRNASAAPATAKVTQSLFDGDRKVAEQSKTVTIAANSYQRDDQLLSIDRPKLWSPGAPHLYRLVTSVDDGRNPPDVTETRIGVRSFAYEGGAFSINGERMFLRGVNRHQEYPYVGYALSPQADYRDAKRIKEAGFDYVRLSHYPQSPAFMAAADELGLLVLDAIPAWQYNNPDPAFQAQVMRTCRDMIRRDRNHPSVLAWECSLNETEMSKDMVRQFNNVIHQEHPGPQSWSAGWQNDGYDIYVQARQHRLQHYETPDRPYIVSEYGDWEYYAQNAGFAQNNWGDLKEEARTSRQALGSGEARLLQQATNVQESHDDNRSTPAFADGYWVMFDYNRGYADDLELSGIMSIDRLPKYAYWFFRSQRDATETGKGYDGGPMVRIASEWTPSSSTNVRVFTNADEVELRLNGKTIARQTPQRDRISQRLSHPPVQFHLDRFEPGKLEAVAYLKGKAVARHSVTTPGKAAKLCVRLDDAGVAAGKKDVLFLRAHMLDDAGQPVSDGADSIAFTAANGWQIVGPAQAQAEGGIASVLVRSPDDGRAGWFEAKGVDSSLGIVACPVGL